jgi:hypothetical protein
VSSCHTQPPSRHSLGSRPACLCSQLVVPSPSVRAFVSVRRMPPRPGSFWCFRFFLFLVLLDPRPLSLAHGSLFETLRPRLAVFVFRLVPLLSACRVPLLSACRVPLLSACTFALGLYLCSRLVPVLSACELSAYAFAPGSVVIIPRLLASIPFSFGRRVLASLGSTFFVSLGLCTSLRASVPRFGTLLCLASGLCDSLWDFCALFQAFVPFFGFSLGLLRTSFGPPRLLRPTFSFGVLIFA